MNPKTQASLTGSRWNARCLSATTKRKIADDNRHPTFNLDNALRARRLRWAGQILRRELEEAIAIEMAKDKHVGEDDQRTGSNTVE